MFAEESDAEKISFSPGPSIKTLFPSRIAEVPDEMTIPAIPLPIRPLLPGFLQALTISNRATVQKLKEMQQTPNPVVGVFMRKKLLSNDLADSPDVIHDLSEICSVGT